MRSNKQTIALIYFFSLFQFFRLIPMKKCTILVTGGAGYIGSHACLQLLENNFNVVVIDNLSNSSITAIKRVEKLSQKTITLIQEDLTTSNKLDDILQSFDIAAVMHFAGLKAVGESVQKPLSYYENNVNGSLRLFKAMNRCHIKYLVFSSSATVYGIPERSPITEDMRLCAVNPYGATKLFIERMIEDMSHIDNQYHSAVLRYFNPVGAHESGEIGENPKGIPNNLMPYITQVAMQKLSKLQIYGNDYDTLDGTGVRDYVHVMDLVEGHIAALNYLMGNPQERHIVVNLGTGKGCSVLDLVQQFSTVNKVAVPYEIVARREGDVACCYADTQKAKTLLGWESTRNIDQMCRDSWQWQSNNPEGYV